MNILVIYTGGTIGSSIKSDNYIDTDETKKYKIIANYENANKTSAEAINFSSITPYEILSEQLKGHHINTLSDCISENMNKYDGIIITHGTDTLLYTAAGLSLLQKELPIPVVLVSSNYVLENDRANGNINFSSAIAFISFANTNGCCGGVYVAYSNDNIVTNIHNGFCLLPHSIYSDEVYSLENNIVGRVENDVFYPNEKYTEFSLTELSVKMPFLKKLTFKEKFDEEAQIVKIDECPGNSYFLPEKQPKAFLITSYHSGTICTKNQSLKSLIAYCDSIGIPIFLLGCEDRIQYETTREYQELGLIVLPKMSPITAYMVLWLGELTC